MTQEFNGFSPEAITFLREVKERNSKDWFEEHRVDYETQIVAPMIALVSDLRQVLAEIDPEIVVIPKVGKSISKLHCDMRFSKFRYRDNVWASFRRPVVEGMEMPEFFFALTPTSHLYGMGIYGPAKRMLETLRKRIDDDPDEVRQVLDPYQNPEPFTLIGDMYKRPLRDGVPVDLQTWYQRKSICLMVDRPNDDILFSPELFHIIEEDFRRAAPLYHYLWNCRNNEGEE